MSEEKVNNFSSYVENELGEGSWVTLFKKIDTEDRSQNGTVYSCLAPKDKAKNAMTNFAWDIGIGDGGPSLVNKGKKVTYESRSSDFLPLVIYRDFKGRRDRELEVLQELILFLDLYYDREKCRYIVDDDSGKVIDVIRVSAGEIAIRKVFLEAFMAAKQMDLLIFFENIIHTNENSPFSGKVERDEIIYDVYVNPSYIKSFNLFVKITGKKLFPCHSLTEENANPFKGVPQYEEFIVEGDDFDNKTFTCDPAKLANYFGLNPDAPQYFTPVFFSKDVMQKYLDNTSSYEILDGAIRMRGYWYLRIDNNAGKHVSVFLGDLGRDLPNTEQKHWKNFNIGQEDREISKTCHERSFGGRFTKPESPDLLFKSTFDQFQRDWRQHYGWDLFLPLKESDSHCFDSLHGLTSNEQSEFDRQILNLTKLTIDSINLKGINTAFETEETQSMKALAKYLSSIEVDFDVNSLLGGLQGLRSSGVAHRRGTRYEKTINKLGINDDNLPESFNGILTQMTLLLQAISKTYEKKSA